MPSSNKPATTTTTQTSAPWGSVSGQLNSMVGNVNTLANDQSRWTPTYSAATQQGIQGLQDAANQPGGRDVLGGVLPGSVAGFNQGLGQLSDVAAGADYNNPWLQASLGQAAGDTINGVNSQFTAAGRYGSGAQTQALTRNLGQLYTQAMSDQYNRGQAAQNQAATTLYGGGYTGAGFAGAYDQSKANPALLNLQAGNLQDQQAANIRQAPMNAINWQNGIISPLGSQYGSHTGTSQTVQPVNPWTQALGYGTAGLGLLSGIPSLNFGGGGGMGK